MLLGIPGDNTFSNYQEANRTFWRNTVIPLITRAASALADWLSPAYGGKLTLLPDLDEVQALAPERDALWSRLQATTFLTDDEKRAAIGYGPKGSPVEPEDPAGADKFNPWHGHHGLFTHNPNGSVIPVAGKKPPPNPPPAPLPRSPTPAPPVAIPPGKSLRNQALAGKNHPVTGIPFDSQGFPDFSSVSQATVQLPHSGNRTADFTAADQAAGFASRPPGTTWHHHQDGHTMQLVPSDIHDRTAHTGSIGIGNLPGKKNGSLP